jgi:hypothetical protein
MSACGRWTETGTRGGFAFSNPKTNAGIQAAATPW